ncbi:hypothetical protein V8G54_008894 [Vigna mungo]|uniref:Uncharacterized protein n=1 Tax=Vigna mungo TaxID=3915 RepID=A0AAQ3S8N6_VIGMU
MRFVKDYGKIVKPLTKLRKKGEYSWTEQAEEAMSRLKKVVTSAPMLVLPDFDQTLHIEFDASGGGVGPVLTQGRRPIAYFSKALSEGSLNKSNYEKELMALVMAIQHWRPYLLRQRFVVHTDQRSLQYLLEQRITTYNQQNWLAKLLGYDFEIVYKARNTNRASNALSRRMEDQGKGEKELRVVARPYWQDFGDILKEVEEDEYLRKVVEDIKKNLDSHPPFTMENERLHYKGRLVISTQSAWIPKLLVEFHLTQTWGHSGVYRTYRRVDQSLYWVGMKKVVTDYVTGCLVCQQHKYLLSFPQGLLQPLPIPNVVREEASMDIIVKLPRLNGFDAMLVVVGRLSKYDHFVPLKHPYLARTIVEVFIKEVVRLHGVATENRDGTTIQKRKLFWKRDFGVATIVYYGKLRKNHKKIRQGPRKSKILGSGVGYV